MPKSRVLVFGSSHIGALKAALANSRSLHEVVDFHFWGATSVQFSEFRVDEDKLKIPHHIDLKIRKRAINSVEEIIPELYECILIHGFKLLRGPRISSFFARDEAGVRRYSSDLLRSLISEQLDVSFAIRLAALWARSSETFLSPSPWRSVALKQSGHIGVSLEDLSELDCILTELCTARGVSYVPQPEFTIDCPFRTKLEFSIDAVNLRAGMIKNRSSEQINDFAHMNDSYGAAVLEQFQTVARAKGLFV